MFRSKDDYFSKIDCPELLKKGKCTILNCIFRHKTDESPKTSRKRTSDATNDGQLEPNKKVHTVEQINADTEQVKDTPYTIPKAIDHIQIPRSERTINTKRLAKFYGDLKHKSPNRDAIESEYKAASGSGNIEQYNSEVNKILNIDIGERMTDPKFILPKEIKTATPATLQVRKKFIQTMVDTIKKHEPNTQTPILEAIEHEYKVAIDSTTNTYSQMIRKKVYELSHPEKFRTVKKRLSEADYMNKLNELVIPRDTLIKYGYIMDIPESIEPVNVRACRRCNNEFKIHEQLKDIECHHHPGKVLKKDQFNRVYECCGGIVGGETDPCEVSKHHVFYLKDPTEMHYVLPFQKTSEIFGENKNSFKAIGIDCEMGFTTRGFELLRITAVDFFSGEDVVDILVRPKGDVIDLNTKWSGIAEIKDEAMYFEDLINLLGEIIDSNTILIGHGLENDMNSMRLIHNKIVDTAVLYPRHKTSPTFRFPLKYLTFKYLGRTIQSGEHDSSEDSLAAIDVVKYFIHQDI